MVSTSGNEGRGRKYFAAARLGLALLFVGVTALRKQKKLPDTHEQKTENKTHETQQHAPRRAPGHKYINYKHASEEEHRTAEQFNWIVSNRLNFFIVFFAFGTAVFAGLAYCQSIREANAAWKQANIAGDSLVESDRAWVVPTGIGFSKPFDGKNLPAVTLNFGNVGHDPAIDVRNFIKVDSINPTVVLKKVVFPGATWMSTDAYFLKRTCDTETAFADFAAAYPGAATSFLTGFIPNSINGADVSATGDTTIMIHGCFKYSSFGDTRYSIYCYFLLPIPGDPPTAWQFRSCPYGDYAN